jgi:AcrR family transcriptional regulator
MTQVASVGRMYAGLPVQDRQRQRRERFLQSGLTIFAREGYANSSVGAICKDAGLSSRQFYEEFTGREALLLELYEMIDRQSRDEVAAAVAGLPNAPALDRIEAGARAYIEAIGVDRRKAQVALVEVIGASIKVEQYRAELRRQWGSVLRDAAEEAVSNGEIPEGDYDIRVTAMIGAVNSVAYEWSNADPRPPLDEVIGTLRRILRGVIAV